MLYYALANFAAHHPPGDRSVQDLEFRPPYCKMAVECLHMQCTLGPYAGSTAETLRNSLAMGTVIDN